MNNDAKMSTSAKLKFNYSAEDNSLCLVDCMEDLVMVEDNYEEKKL